MNKKQQKTLKNIILSTFLLVVITIVLKLTDRNLEMSATTERVTATLLYLIPYLIVGGRVLVKAGKNIRNGQIFDENFLMVIATIGAFVLGEYIEAVAVMLFYQIGELFENIAVNKSRNAITSLVNLRPDYANIEKAGELIKVDPYDVAVGDTIIVLAGEKIPLDGVIVEGESYVNTSALTGESVPRGVKLGDTILSGCINEQGKLKIRVTKEFDDSTVAKILDMVENAGSKKSRSESFITRFAKYYTPAVVITAVVVALFPPLIFSQSFTKWIGRALIFLVISCPCALVISVPLGFFGGIGISSKLGILVKGSNYLEVIAQADTVVFDKTGTLTEGVFKVNEIVSLSDIGKDKLLELAAYAECYSNHPIAHSIERAYEESGNIINKNNISDVIEIAGKGVSISLKNSPISDSGDDGMEAKKYYAGNIKLINDQGITIKESAKEHYGTVVYVADSNECLGYIIISDVVKKDAKDAISRMHSLGIRNSVMLTGDRAESANAVAKELGIKEVHSELLPGDKLKCLEDIISTNKEKTDGKPVAFVGDGINDAPSLIRADVGIAMGAMGQDAAIEAADIVLMDDNPKKIATVQLIGRKTLKIVRQNIVFALAIKFLAMVLGVLGIANMWIAVFADVGVSVIAILNSMRMLKFREG